MSTGAGGSGPATRPRRWLTASDLWGYAFIGPWIVGLLLFTLGPFLASLYLSFTEYQLVGAPTWIGLRNYEQLFASLWSDQGHVYVWISLKNTVYYTLLHVPLSMLLAYLLRQFMLTLPTELDDAARIDGANPLDIYWRIILPLATPALATVGIFSFVYHWNDFFGPLIYLTTPEKMTIAVGLQLFRGQWGTDFSLLMAASTAAVLPIVVLFFFAQKTFIQGIALTGMKG